MRFSLLLVGLAALLPPLVAQAEKPDDIIGLRTADENWLLGAAAADIALDEFEEFDCGSSELRAFCSPARKLKLLSVEQTAITILVFREEQLAAALIGIRHVEESYAELHLAYSKRLKLCERLVSRPAISIWADAADDQLALLQIGDSQDYISWVIFCRPALASPPDKDGLPQWAYDMGVQLRKKWPSLWGILGEPDTTLH